MVKLLLFRPTIKRSGGLTCIVIGTTVTGLSISFDWIIISIGYSVPLARASPLTVNIKVCIESGAKIPDNISILIHDSLGSSIDQLRESRPALKN